MQNVHHRPKRALAFSDIFPKQLVIFSPNFTRLLYVPIYVRLQICIQLSATLTKLCHIKCDHLACVSADGGHFEHMFVCLFVCLFVCFFLSFSLSLFLSFALSLFLSFSLSLFLYFSLSLFLSFFLAFRMFISFVTGTVKIVFIQLLVLSRS